MRDMNFMKVATLILLLPFVQVFAQEEQEGNLWEQQRDSVAMACVAQDMLQDLEGVYTTLEKTNTTGACTNDMLHLLGVCEQNNNAYAFCETTRTYIDKHKLEQLSERPVQLSQERIDKINGYDWNKDGKTDGTDFVSK
jgi:hypothetical protein